jgi:enterochelin esterase-like enzyme
LSFQFARTALVKSILSGANKQIKLLNSGHCRFIEILIFGVMQTADKSDILIKKRSILSAFLSREVVLDFYIPQNISESQAIQLLLVNDGQDLEKMGYSHIVDKLYTANEITGTLLSVGIHCGTERKREYGVAGHPDYKDRGDKAAAYTSFIVKELLPYINTIYSGYIFNEKAFAGFSLGALAAMDIVWNHPDIFNKAGCFSSSFWWRSIDQQDLDYDDDTHRIIHKQIRAGKYSSVLKFFFQCGNLDETRDRNRNGVIDSIDDTLDLIKELVDKGYDPKKDIHYMEIKDGHHDIFTWGRAMPEFLKWAWGV